MLKKRIIPIILLRDGSIVQSREFKKYQILGSPTASVQRFSNWSSDELIYIDISNNQKHELQRDDLNQLKFQSIINVVELISKKCLMPLTFGGGIRTIEDVRSRIKLGADKITINTLAIENPELITKIASEFGSQCIVVSIDVKKNEKGEYLVYKGGKHPTDINPMDLAKKVEKLGAGEILLNSIDRDGTGEGFDIELINMVNNVVKIPLIACGGAGKWEDFENVFKKTNSNSVAAANIFHHSENSVYNLKKYLYEKKIPVRKPIRLSYLNTNL